MKRVNDWLAREIKRQGGHPSLEHALLTDRAFGYVNYRLRSMWLRVFVRCAVHVLELMLLSTVLPEDWLAVFIGYRTSTGLMSSLYWGVLEQLRESVRAHMRRNHFGSARLVIANWLRVSVIVSALGLCAVGVWIANAPPQFAELAFFHVFGVACFVRLAFDLWARTLHSGIFATKRVYRPLWSLLLPDLIEIGLLIVLFPPYDLLAFLAMVVGGGLVRIGLSNHFSKRAYRSSRLQAPSMREALFGRNVLSGADLWSAAKLGVSNATSQLDGLIIMLLLFSGASSGEGATFAGVYYVLRPLMAVAHGWARAFYFDFKRIESSTALFQRRFRSLLTRTAVVLAAVVALLVLAATALLSRGAPDVSLLCLVPFFVARSLMSVRQLEAFTSGAHAALLRISVGLFGALASVAWITRDEIALLLAASVLLMVAARLLPTASRSVTSVISGLPRFMARVHREKTPVRLSVLTLDRDVTTASRFVQRLSEIMEHGSIARFGRSHVLVVEPASHSKVATARDAALIGAGTVAAYRSLEGEDGHAALRGAMEDQLWPHPLTTMLNDAAQVDLIDAYRRAHPQGTVIDATRGRISDGRTISPRELRAVMNAIRIQARGGTERASRKLDVMVYAPGGEPETIFITPSPARPSVELRRKIQGATLRASLHMKS